MPRTLADVAAELYALKPEEFVTRRTAEAKATRAEGDAGLAAAINTLRKPTVSAWVLNQYVRSHADVVEQLTGLGRDLREAESTMSADDLRRLSTARNQLVESLARDAVASSGVAKPTASLVDEVRSTLSAAVADESVAEALASGALVKSAEWSGFGATDPEELAPVRPSAPPGPQKQKTTKPSTRTAQTAEERRAADRSRRAEQLQARLSDATGALTEAQRDLEEATNNEQRLEDRVAQIRAELAEALTQLKDAQDATRRVRRLLGDAEREHKTAARAMERHEAQS